MKYQIYRNGGISLWHEKMYCSIPMIDPEDIKDRISQMPLHDETVHFGKKAVFWGKYTEKEFLRTSYHKLLMKEKFYPLITIRNGRTFDTLGEMLG